MTDVAEETFFNKEYMAASFWYGIGIINALAGLGMYMYLPGRYMYGKGVNDDKNWWTR